MHMRQPRNPEAKTEYNSKNESTVLLNEKTHPTTVLGAAILRLRRCLVMNGLY